MKQRARLQTRVSLLILVAVAPAWLTAAVFLWNWDVALAARLAILVLITIVAFAAGIAVLHRIVRPLQSLANMLEGLREGDYSLRGRTVDPEDALGEVGPRQLDDFVEDLQAAVFLAGHLSQCPQRAQSQPVSQRLGIAGMVDVLVPNRIDVAGAALQKEGDRALAQIVLDDLGGKPGQIRRVLAAGHSLDGMARKVVDNGQGFALADIHDKGGLGLISMRERAAKIGGQLIIHSVPGEGTRVTITVPLTGRENPPSHSEGSSNHPEVTDD